MPESRRSPDTARRRGRRRRCRSAGPRARHAASPGSPPGAARPDARTSAPRSSLALLVEVEHGEERLLRDLDAADLLHALLALLLPLEELPLAGDVAAVALREHVLPFR